jgi:hypothetical protein
MSKKLRKEVKENSIPFWAQPTTKLEFHITEVQKIKEETMEESLGLGKKSYGTETDPETQSWFQLPIPKPGFGRTLITTALGILFFGTDVIQATDL